MPPRKPGPENRDRSIFERLSFKHLALFLLNQPQSALQTELNGFFQQVTGAALESCKVTASKK